MLDLDLSVVDVGRAHLEFGAYVLRPQQAKETSCGRERDGAGTRRPPLSLF